MLKAFIALNLVLLLLAVLLLVTLPIVRLEKRRPRLYFAIAGVVVCSMIVGAGVLVVMNLREHTVSGRGLLLLAGGLAHAGALYGKYRTWSQSNSTRSQ